MVQVAWSTSNLKVYTARDGSATVCESCCANEFSEWGEGDSCPCVACRVSNGGPGRQPNLIKVVVSGVTQSQGGCYNHDEGGSSLELLSNVFVDNLCNRTWNLTHSSSCLWSEMYDAGLGNVKYQKVYYEENCAGDYDYRACRYSKLTLEMTGDPLQLVIKGQFWVISSIWRDWFYHVSTISNVSDELCIPIGSYGSNTGDYIPDCGDGNFAANTSYSCLPLVVLGSGIAVVSIPTIAEGNENLCTE